MKDPAVLFYTQDFITGTLLMTDEQRGKYILLLCLQHQNGKLTERDMLKICGAKDEDIWQKFNQEGEFFYNKRMLIESDKRKIYCAKQKERIQKYWDDKNYHGNATVVPLENENENENENIIEDKDERIKNKEAEFKSEVFEFMDKYSEVMLDKFCNYWTEKNKSKTKMRFELEKTFEISRRLITWAFRDNNFVKHDTLKINNEIPKYKIFTYEQMLEKLDKAGGIMSFWNDYKEIKMKDLPKKVWIHVNDIAMYNIISE